MLGRHADAELGPVIEQRPVVGDVPAELGMTRNDAARGDVASAVAGVPQRERPLQDIDVLATDDDFLAARGAAVGCRWHAGLELPSDMGQQLILGGSQRQSDAAPCAVDVHHQRRARVADAMQHGGRAVRVG